MSTGDFYIYSNDVISPPATNVQHMGYKCLKNIWKTKLCTQKMCCNDIGLIKITYNG